jgi:hypothetical protein
MVRPPSYDFIIPQYIELTGEEERILEEAALEYGRMRRARERAEQAKREKRNRQRLERLAAKGDEQARLELATLMLQEKQAGSE